jgi:hypothetical protein
MPTLTLAATLAIEGPERERLVEADDAIRDVAAAVEEAAGRDGLDAPLVSQGLVGLMLAAAARQALAAYPSMAKHGRDEAFVALAAEAFDWARSRNSAIKRERGV